MLSKLTSLFLSSRFASDQNRPPPPLPSSSSSAAPLLARVRSTRRGPPAPIQIFSPLLRSPPKIDISPSGDPNERDPNQQARVSEIGGRRRSATLQPSTALSSGTPSSGSYDTHDGSGGSSPGLEEAVVSRGKLVSMYEISRGSTVPVPPLRKPSTSMEEVRSPPLLRTPGSNHQDHPPTPYSIQSPSSVYSDESAPGRIGASLIQL